VKGLRVPSAGYNVLCCAVLCAVLYSCKPNQEREKASDLPNPKEPRNQIQISPHHI